MVNLIAGVTENFCLGKDGDLVVKNSEDLKLFKDCTSGKVVVMGRKTWESLPKKPLEGRINIILTSDEKMFKNTSDVIFTDLSGFKRMFDCNIEYWIIGGAEIYSMFLKEGLVDNIFLSKFKGNVEGDTFFPEEYLKNFKRKYITYYKTFVRECWER